MKINLDFFPDWKTKAVTFSYDDGTLSDWKLEKIFFERNLKCTYNISSSFIEKDKAYVDFSFLETLQGQEIASHGETHSLMTNWNESMILSEFFEDKKFLERRLKRIIRGIAYPYGYHTPAMKQILRFLGIEYARTVSSLNQFSLPTDFLEWNPTCHHHTAETLIDPFFSRGKDLRLFYIWGHSFEFERENNWVVMQKIADRLYNKSDVWYATNIEICQYINAVRRLKKNTNGHIFYNDSSINIFLEVNSKQRIIYPGYNELDE